MAKEILIYGAGGLGREIKTIISHINMHIPNSWILKGFIDDGYPIGTNINGIEVLGGMEELKNWDTPIHVIMGIGQPELKVELVQPLLTNSFIIFPTLIHPSVIIGDSDSISIGSGSVIGAGSILTTDISIGNHALINLSVTIGHDSHIGSFCSIMPGVNISGEVTLEEQVFVGSGANIINQLTIGAKAKIGAGAVVISHIAPGRTAVGVPAKMIKKED